MSTGRKRTRSVGTAGPDPLRRIGEFFGREPSAALPVVLLLAAVAGLYASALGYPLVFGDFALLAADRLAANAGWPAFEPGALARASFGWTARFAAADLGWHRAVALALHAVAVVGLFLLLRRLGRVALGGERAGRIAPSWLAFLAAALLALHPAAVYAVAYLAQRQVLVATAAAMLALLALARGAQDGRLLPLAAVPLFCGIAIWGSPAALSLPLVLALLLWLWPPVPGRVRTAAGLAVVAAGLLALAFFASMPAGDAAWSSGIAEHVGRAASRLVQHHGYWLLPYTPWMAIDIPEPVAPGFAFWPGAAAILCLLAAGGAGIWLCARRGAPRLAGFALLVPVLLYVPALVWPRLAPSFDLGQGYAWMPLVLAVVVAALSRAPAYVAWLPAGALCLVVALLGDGRVRTFATHAALWDDAVARAERVGAGPETARVWLNRAALHRRDGHVFAAIADYDKALALVPDDPRALRGRAQVHLDAGQHDEALRDLDRLLQLEPERRATLVDRAVVLLEAGRAGEALRELDRALGMGVREARLYLNRGIARFKLGGLNVAPAVLADLDRAAELDPGYALPYFNRGLVFEEAASVGLNLRDAPSPDMMRMIARQNYLRACERGHRPACTAVRRVDKAGPGQEPATPLTPATPQGPAAPTPR